MEYQKDEHRVHLIAYHLVWTPKRRKPILIGDIANDCRHLIQEQCELRGWEIQELNIQPDHIHLFVRVYPEDSPAKIVKECKGITSFHLRKKYPEILSRLPSLWTRNYFVATVGNESAEASEKYIESQRGI